MLPLSFSLSSRQLRLITALGTGVLVGTSLIVIIPEGIETLYSAGDSGHGHGHGERSLSSSVRRVEGRDAMFGGLRQEIWRREAVAMGADVGVPVDTNVGFVTGPDDAFHTAEEGVKQTVPATDGASEEAGLPNEHKEGHANEEGDEHHDAGPEPHAWVGISLITGFILMYLIDTLPQHATKPSQPQRFSISLNQFSFNRTASIPANEAAEEQTQETFTGSHNHSYSRPSSTTVGLVIHAAADGIALGASSTTTSRLTFIIFLALMIHKAPAAFGLTSVLLKQGLSKRMARAHLIVFSLAAPIGALLTWSAAHLLGYSSASAFGNGNSGSTEFATGVLLLFSAGTFLYVAMHTMQENGSGHGEEVQGNGYAGVPMHDMYSGEAQAPPKSEGPALLDTVVTVGGMLLPLLTQWGHAH